MNMFRGIKDKIKEKYLDSEFAEREKLLIEHYTQLEVELRKEYEDKLKEEVRIIEERFIEETNNKLLMVCREYQRFFNEKLDSIEKVYKQIDFQAEQFNIFLTIQIEQIHSKLNDYMKQQSTVQLKYEIIEELKKLYAREPKDSFMKKILVSRTDVCKNLERVDSILVALSKNQLTGIDQVKHKVSIDTFFQLENNLLKEIKSHYINESQMESIKNNYINTFECCVCLEKSKVDHVWSGCGHTNTCRSCSANLKACPICRKPGGLIHLYI